MRTHKETLDWSIERQNAAGEYVETCYEITVDITPGEAAKTYGRPEDCHDGSPAEVEILRIMQGKLNVPEKDWEAYGFTKEELERVEEAALEIDSEPDYEERD